MYLGGRLKVCAVAVLLFSSAEFSEVRAQPHPTDVRLIRVSGHEWEEGTLVSLTSETLVISRGRANSNDTLSVRDLSALELSSHTKTSVKHTLDGLMVGILVGGTGGALVGGYAGRDEEMGGLSAIGGALIGGIIGGVVGLVVGQNPVPVWEPVPIPIPDSWTWPKTYPPNSALHAPGAWDGQR